MANRNCKNWNYEFWIADRHGLVRVRQAADELCRPEVWRGGEWEVGSPYVMDAITGMGEDPYSCGEYADELSLAEAESYAAKNGVDLFAENAEEH